LTPEPTGTPEPTSTPEPTATPIPDPTISPAFISQLNQFLQLGSELNTATGQGINFANFSDRLAAVGGAYDLAAAAWPDAFPEDSKADFEAALEGWELAKHLWGLSINDSDNPVEPDINGYLTLLEYGGDSMLLDIHPEGYIVPEYRNKQFMPFDENVSILLGLASDYFETGREKALQLIQ
jgi:hypothetical protein